SPSHAQAWQALRYADDGHQRAIEQRLNDPARVVLAALRSKGASFFRDLKASCDMNDATLTEAIATLAAFGLATSDGFAGLRSIVRALKQQDASFNRRHDLAGRWSATPVTVPTPGAREAAVETQARVLLERYGVVFRRMLARETNAATWRELTNV